MPFDFRKLGLDRMATGIAKSVGGGQSTISTGDINKGEYVTHTTTTSGVETIDIRTRATGCFCVTAWFVNDGSADVNWKLDAENNQILVKTSTGTNCEFVFYVW